MRTSAAIKIKLVTVDPGTSESLDVIVRNTSSIVDSFLCEVVGEPAAWSIVEPPAVSLLPGGEASVRVTISPPRTAAVLAGRRPIAIRITPSEHPDEATVEESEVDVLPFLDLGGELLPNTARARRWGSTQVALDNRGNRPAQVLLTAADPEEAVEFQLTDELITVPPGEATFVAMRLRAKKRPFAGRPIVLPITVTAEPDDGDIAIFNGGVQQVARIPQALLRTLILLGIGLLALLIMWFALLKPTLESTAREAVEREVAAAEEAAQTAGDAAGEADVAAGEAAGAAGDAVGAAAGAAAVAEEAAAQGAAAAAADDASAAAVAGDAVAGQLRPGVSGNPFDFRLSAAAAPGSSATNTFTVPDQQTLFLTDIVLQNPQGDTGTLQLRRGTGVLLEVRLENFRDLDYHFVAPIVYTSGQQVVFVVACDRDDGTVCNAAGYFAGFLTPPPPPAPA